MLLTIGVMVSAVVDRRAGGVVPTTNHHARRMITTGGHLALFTPRLLLLA
jgi:hypothetical protein